MKKIIVSISIMVLGVTGLLAQTTTSNCVGFSSSLEDTSGDLSDQVRSSLKLKVDQIITRNKVATTTLYNAFIVTPYIDVISEESVNSGIRPVSTVLAEVTLIASNSVDESVYGSVTVEVKGNGNSLDQAMSSVVSSLKPTDPRFTKFINTAVSQITSYYSSNMPTIIRKAETLISAKKYDEAIMFLESIPTCVPSYEQSSDAIQALYKMVEDKECYVAVSMAQRHITMGEYTEARDILMGVTPGSDCDGTVSKLLSEVASYLGIEQPVGDEDNYYDEPQDSQPEPNAEAQGVVATLISAASNQTKTNDTSSGGVLLSDFKNFEVTLVSCKGNAADNTVEMVILVRNTSELPNTFWMSMTNNRTFLHNDDGDTFYCKSISERTFELQPDMPRKVTLTFERVPSSNLKLSGMIGAHDTVDSSIKVTDMSIKWLRTQLNK
ncbi:MAG: hypothetical protein R3Y19_01030 [Rikenellaceae bacterium]